MSSICVMRYTCDGGCGAVHEAQIRLGFVGSVEFVTPGDSGGWMFRSDYRSGERTNVWSWCPTCVGKIPGVREYAALDAAREAERGRRLDELFAELNAVPRLVDPLGVFIDKLEGRS